jgi:hypothetical protein
MKRIVITLLNVFFLFGCTSHPKKNVEIETIDLKKVSTKPFSLVETMGILSAPVQIPLHFSEEMYLKKIDIFKVYNKKFYVADKYWRDANLIVFDSDGMPISTIGRRGRGPGEYFNIADFDIDSNGNIHLIDGNTNHLLLFTADYRFIETIKLPFSVDLIKCLDNGNYLLALSSWNTGEYENDMLVITDKKFNVLESVIKYDKSVVDNNLRLSSSHFVEAFGKIFFKQANIDDRVYVMNQDGHLNLIYHFDFGSQKVPYAYRSNLEPYFDARTLHNYRTLINFTIVNERYVLGTMWDKGITKVFLLTRGNRTMYEKPNFQPNSTSEIFLSILEDKLVTLITNTNEITESVEGKSTWSDYTLCFYTLQ